MSEQTEPVPGIGDNSKQKKPRREAAISKLRALVDRVERLEGERKDVSEGIRDIYLEAKSAGFDVKVLRALIRLRKQDPAKVEEEEATLETYKHAVGM